jgi:hypothetical protein
MTLSRRYIILLFVLAGFAGTGCKMLPGNLPRLGADSTPEPVDPSNAAETRTKPKTSSSNHRIIITDSSRSADAENFAKIRRNLRALVTAEETFFAENGAYSDDFNFVRFKPEDEVKVRFLWISPRGWAASGTHPALQGRDCVTFVGKADAPPTTLRFVRRGREGVLVCDDSSRSSRPVAPSPAEVEAGNVLADLSPPVAMKVDLRNLVHSQSVYFATQGIYARRTETLALQYLWHPGVRVKILSADAQSWSAKATHFRFPGGSCVIYMGAVREHPLTDRRGVRASSPGVPVCDE